MNSFLKSFNREYANLNSDIQSITVVSGIVSVIGLFIVGFLVLPWVALALVIAGFVFFPLRLAVKAYLNKGDF